MYFISYYIFILTVVPRFDVRAFNTIFFLIKIYSEKFVIAIFVLTKSVDTLNVYLKLILNEALSG